MGRTQPRRPDCAIGGRRDSWPRRPGRVAPKREQSNQLAQAAQNDPVVRPYRSFLNLSEGKAFCIMEAPDQAALAAWFQKMQMPCDYITPVELEGERGVVKEVGA